MIVAALCLMFSSVGRHELFVMQRIQVVGISLLIYVLGSASVTAVPLIHEQLFSPSWEPTNPHIRQFPFRRQVLPSITIHYKSEIQEWTKNGSNLSNINPDRNGQNFSSLDDESNIDSDTVQFGVLFSNVISKDLLERDVPEMISRFDYPWNIPRRWKPLTLQQSRNRILYSPVRDKSGAGLGHAMATVNADISAAIRMNLTYTHRIPMCGSLSRPPKDTVAIDNVTRLFHHAGAVEQLFGWGVGEIPRERVQAAVNATLIYEMNNFACRVIDNKQLLAQKSGMHRHRRNNATGHTRFALRVDRIVEIPPHLAYHYPHFPTETHKRLLDNFLKRHPEPYTVFSMPSEFCNRIPAYGVESLQQRSFFFHKYWDAHGHGASKQPRTVKFDETFDEYRKRVTNSMSLGKTGSRPRLSRLREDFINIAVHARRGDFFEVHRPMLTISTIANVIRQVVGEVIEKRKSIFSEMKVSVAIYSEGLTLHSNRTSSDHEVEKMRHDFLDVDRTVLDEVAIRNLLMMEKKNSIQKHIFKNGLQVSLRVSEDTVLCVHEMIAADVFIGSESGLSSHVVGSTSRAAFILTPSRHPKATGRFAIFDKETGAFEDTELHIMRYLWKRFVTRNQASVRKAISTKRFQL